MWRMGAYNANRVLELEDENTIGADGEHYFVQSGYVPADIAANPPKPVAPAAPAAPAALIAPDISAVTDLAFEIEDVLGIREEV
jgi:hypothetical protein